MTVPCRGRPLCSGFPSHVSGLRAFCPHGGNGTRFRRRFASCFPAGRVGTQIYIFFENPFGTSRAERPQNRQRLFRDASKRKNGARPPRACARRPGSGICRKERSGKCASLREDVLLRGFMTSFQAVPACRGSSFRACLPPASPTPWHCRAPLGKRARC